MAHPDRHGIVSGIIIPPHFRPSTALLGCEKDTLRWPGPFDSGFLSPQPPGVVGIGPIRRIIYPDIGPTRVGPFLFLETLFSFWTMNRRAFRVPPVDALSQRRSRPALSYLLFEHDLFRKTGAHFFRTELQSSEARCKPRRASARACRGCRPGYRPPRHRCPRGKYFPAALSSCWHCRSSRRPSARCGPHCSR
jgi:hypothetical protein